MNTTYFIETIDLMGTFAFAISGIRLASEKKFDLFGAFIIGMVTAVGGGTLRDLMLGLNPFWMTQWTYFAVNAFALVVFLFAHEDINKLNKTIFLFDAIGLALFTAVGYQKTLDYGFQWWVAVIMAMITGSAGGVLRDIFLGKIPIIFRHDIYALACVLGGIVYTICLSFNFPPFLQQISCAATVLITRLLAAKYNWGLPHLKEQSTKQNT